MPSLSDHLRAEGREQVLREGRVLALLDLIRLSLGGPSPALTTRVTAEAGQNPGPWLDRILAAASLADLEPAGG